MYYHDTRLQHPVRVTEPDPAFARSLQQAIGGVEGEIRVCMQYFFHAWNARGPDNRYRDMLLHMATEEISHIEMLATAVALNVEVAPAHLQEEGVKDKLVGAVIGGERPRAAIEGMIHKHMLSAGLGVMPIDSDGVPFNMSHIYANGNLAADMTANVAAESTGRVLAVRLYNQAHDEGMRDMLSFLIARDTMDQNQWLAVIEDLGGFSSQFPIPNSFPQEMERASSATNTSSPPPTAAFRKAAGARARAPTARANSSRPPSSRWARSLCSGRRDPTAARRRSRWAPGPWRSSSRERAKRGAEQAASPPHFGAHERSGRTRGGAELPAAARLPIFLTHGHPDPHQPRRARHQRGVQAAPPRSPGEGGRRAAVRAPLGL
jgi:Mn-containing catalase